MQSFLANLIGEGSGDFCAVRALDCLCTSHMRVFANMQENLRHCRWLLDVGADVCGSQAEAQMRVLHEQHMKVWQRPQSVHRLPQLGPWPLPRESRATSLDFRTSTMASRTIAVWSCIRTGSNALPGRAHDGQKLLRQATAVPKRRCWSGSGASTRCCCTGRRPSFTGWAASRRCPKTSMSARWWVGPDEPLQCCPVIVRCSVCIGRTRS